MMLLSIDDNHHGFKSLESKMDCADMYLNCWLKLELNVVGIVVPGRKVPQNFSNNFHFG